MKLNNESLESVRDSVKQVLAEQIVTEQEDNGDEDNGGNGEDRVTPSIVECFESIEGFSDVSHEKDEENKQDVIYFTGPSNNRYIVTVRLDAGTEDNNDDKEDDDDNEDNNEE